MASSTQSGVNIDELMEALSRLGSSDQRPPTQQESSVIGHFTDLRDFLGRNSANVPFGFVEDPDDGVIDLVPVTPSGTGTEALTAPATAHAPDAPADATHTAPGRK